MGAPYGNFGAPCKEAKAVTKSDSVVYSPPARAFYVGTGGDVTVIMADGDKNSVLLKAVPAGSWHPLSVVQIMSAGTSASDLVIAW